MKICRFALAVAMLAAVAACSPYGFSKEVSDIDSSAKTFQSSVDSGHKALVEDATSVYRRNLIAARSPVVIPASCRTSPPPVDPVVFDTTPKKPDDKGQAKPDGAKVSKPAARVPCDVYLERDRATGRQDPLPIPDEFADIMGRLTAYTGALAAVTNATDRTNYDAAVGKLATAVGTMVSAAVPTAAPVGVAVGAGINVFGWLVGTALDIQRFESLKKGVNAVDTVPEGGIGKPFDVVVNSIAAEIDLLAEKRRKILSDQMTDLVRTLNSGIGQESYRATLADAQTIAAALDSLNQNGAQTAANALIVAHGKLVVAVNAYQPDLGDLMTTIGTLKDKVTALQAALSAASAPAPSAKKGS